MTVPGWYRRLFALFPDGFRREAEAELLEMAEAEWTSASARGSGARRVAALRLLADQLATAARAWAGWLAGRRAGRAGPLDGLGQDLRYAWRGLARTPGFVGIAVVVIGLGVGATTTIVTVANTLLLRQPAGVRGAERLITVHSRSEDGSSFHSFSYPNFRDLSSSVPGVELAAFSNFNASLVVGGEPQFTGGFAVTSGYFPILGVRPALGRLFGPGDDQGIGGPRVVVLSHETWRNRFGADSGLVGRAVTLNGEPFTVVGVAEAGFRGHVAAFAAALWVPVEFSQGPARASFLTDRRISFLEIIGRSSLAAPQVEERLTPVYARIGRAGGLDWDRSVDVRRYSAVPASVLMPVIGFLGLLVVLGGSVLLISSTNIAGLMLARAMARRRETAVRLAIGASRGRLIRQLLAESFLVFLGGGAVGTAIAWLATAAAGRAELPVPIPIVLDFPIDLRVLAISLGSALLAGLGFGLVPALQATAPGLAGALKDDGSVAGAGRTRIRSVLVAAQVAASALLIVTAGLFVRTLSKAAAVDVGFDPAGIQIGAVELSVLHYDEPRTAAFAEAVERKLAAQPGVISVGVIDLTPLSFGNQGSVVAVDGRELRDGVGIFWTDFAHVSPGYFATMSIPLVRGRSFGAGDRAGAPLVVIVNETLAERIWPGEDPVGKALRWGQLTDGTPATVVGVARNGKYRSLAEEPVSMVYLAIAQDRAQQLSFLTKRKPGDPGAAAAMRLAIHEVDPNLPLSTNVGYDVMIGLGLLPNRLAAGAATAFGLVGLTLATVGLYGVLSYLVVRRRREIGIRMALGAPAGHVRRLVLREGLKLTVVGLTVGTGAALVLARLIRSLLFGLDTVDLVSVAVTVVLLAAVAALASDLPARRAARTAPIEVLRHD